MPQFLFSLLEVVLPIFMATGTIVLLLWSIGNIKNKVPFVTASSAVLEDIKKAMDVKDNSAVYDLGCGDGKILFYLSRFNKNAKYIGIENNLLALFLAKLGAFFNFKKTGNKVDIINDDFFKQDLSKATHLFTYLYPNVMDELLPKFKDELTPGTRLVSLSFKFTSKMPISEIDLNRSKYKLGRKLYVYQF